MPIESGQSDRVICFSVWPHLDDPKNVLAEFYRVLKPGGHLHVWHIDSKETINKVHTEAGHAVSHDLLIPAAELAEMIASCGFEVARVVDDDKKYLVSARRLSDRV